MAKAALLQPRCPAGRKGDLVTYHACTPFHSTTHHKCCFVFHASLKGMRSCLTRLGHKDSSDTLACCWQSGKFDGEIVAEIHYALDVLTLEILAHECVHAASHRVKLVGSADVDWNEEELADNAGRLTKYAHSAWQKIKRLHGK